MAKVKLNPIIKAISGKMGDVVFRTSKTGEITVAKTAGRSGVKASQAQKEHRRRFRQAAIYARAAMAVPEIRLFYLRMAAKRKKNNRPFDMAVSDYFKGNNLLLKK